MLRNPAFIGLFLATLSAYLPAQCASVETRTLRNFDPWAASFHTWANATSSMNFYFDIDTQVPIEVETMSIPTYNQGLGSPVIPSQVGNRVEVRVYLTPGSRTGNESNRAMWGLSGAGVPDARGVMTVVAFPGESPITDFRDLGGAPAPFLIPVGSYGLCIEVISTTWSGTAQLPGQTNVPLLNPGRIEAVVGFQNPATSWSDPFVTLSNGGVMQYGWWVTDPAGNLVPNPVQVGVSNTYDINLAIDYRPGGGGATAALPIGPGCYDSPRAVFERVSSVASAADLRDTQWTLAFVPDANGGHYDVSPGGPVFDGPTAVSSGANLLAMTPTSSSASGWNDGSLVYPLPSSTFPGGLPFPGGSCTEITINSNGKIFLGATTDPAAAINGHDGTLASFRDHLPLLAPFHAQFLYYSPAAFRIEDPSPNGGVRITWRDVQVAGTANSRCDVQVEMLPSGAVTFAYGAQLVPNPLRPAIVGFSPGGGQPLGEPIDWSALTQHTTGTGATAPRLLLSGPPAINTTIDAVIDNLGPNPAQPIGGFLSLGFAGLPTGLPLDGFGLPGCESHLDLGLVLTSVLLGNATNTDMRWSWAVPAAANGVPVYLQSGVFGPTPGNAVGITLTNGICAQVGF